MSADEPEAYTVIAHGGDAEIEVRRSRFLARVRPAADEDAARRVMDRARREHPDARHHCSAFIVGPRSGITRSNDDGEPSGTAGGPILQALAGRGVSDAVAVVTRYFGGALLGTGGLARAYGGAASAALDAAGTAQRVRVVHAHVLIGIGGAGRLDNDLRAAGYRIAGTDYDAEAATATLRIAVPVPRVDAFAAEVAARTGGDAVVSEAGRGWDPVPAGHRTSQRP